MQTRRFLVILASMTAASLALSACGGAATTPTTSASPASSSAAANLTGTVRIVMGSAPASDKAYAEVNAAFEKKYPGVKVEFSAVPTNNFTATRASRLTAGDVDITTIHVVNQPSYVTDAAVSEEAAAVDAGVFADLTDEPFMSNYSQGALDAVRYKDRLYVVPTGVTYYTGVFYNKKIFADHNLSVPTTWAEWQTTVKALQDAGVAPLGIGGKESWPAGLEMLGAAQSIYPTAEEKSQLTADLWGGKVRLDEGKQLLVMRRVQELYGVAQKNFAGVGYDTIPADFAAGKFAMIMDGTWNQTVIDTAVGDSFDYGYFPLPSSDNAADNKLLGGKVELRLAAVNDSPNKTAALAWLDFFSQPDVYAKFVATAGYAPAQPNIATSDFLKSIAEYTSTFSPAWDQYWVSNQKAGAEATFPFNYAGIAPLGKQTAEEAAKAAESAWEAGLK